MATAYEGYRQLDETRRQIRLITLHGANVSSCDNTEDVITCTLESVDLRHANPFYALSYVWGPPAPTGPISVNGQIVHVRRNLWLFLLALKERFCNKTKGSSIRVWADYICIHQSNIQERNFQVAMMGDVYNAADAIYAWLGESATPVDDGMRCIAEAAALRKQRVSWTQIRRELGSIEDRIRVISTSLYWNRMWIKQEALLAKDLWFFYGEQVAHWKDIWFTIQLYPASANREKQITSSRAMQSLFQARERGTVQYELRDLVQRFADASCEDPRDRIYALLALIDQKTGQQIVVDYDKPVLQVLLETYPYWAPGGVTGSRQDKVVPDTWVYHTFCTAIHRFLPSSDLGALHSSKDARGLMTAQGVFAATDVATVDSVCPIAVIGESTVDPMSRVHEADSERSAFILRVNLQAARSRTGTRPRQCFMYADIIPDPETLVVWTGHSVVFANLLEHISGAQVRRPKDLFVVGTGTEIREINLPTGGAPQLSRQVVLHPCLWLNDRLDDAQFTVSVSRSQLERKDMSITCNAAAIVSLLHEFKRDQETTMPGTGSSSPSSELAAYGLEAKQPRRWSPYAFGIEHKLLQPCQLCKGAGRSAAFAKRRESAADGEQTCECRWIHRVQEG